MNPALSLVIGVAGAWIGGELFVRGLTGLARWARVSAGLVATTIAATATSCPELAVGVGAAWSGHPEISLGDALGSNVVNVALVLALALCVSAIACPRAALQRDFPVALLVPVAVGALGLDGRLSRLDGAALLAAFCAWVALMVANARREQTAAAGAEVAGHPRIVAQLAVGLIGLIGCGHFIVQGARGIAATLGLPEFAIGATVVAIGTSTPELATALISKLRGHDEIGLGTVLGSNVFNGLFIVGLAAVICPIRVDWPGAAWVLGFGLLTTIMIMPGRTGSIGRWRGALLLATYATYALGVLRPGSP